MSDTPRTDAAVDAGGCQLLNVAECSRQLERELSELTHGMVKSVETIAELREKVAQLEGALALGQENCDAAYGDLREERDEARANEAAALGLVSRIREALGDNGRHMQPELIAYCRELV